MTLDSMTRRNLELVEPLRPHDGDVSLLSVLDATTTPMGARLLRGWLLNPQLDPGEIRSRQAGVAEFFEEPDARTRLRAALRRIRDLDRLGTKIGSGRSTPREVLALGNSIRELPAVASAGKGLESEVLCGLVANLDTLEDVETRIAEAIAEDAPAVLADGDVIREGFSEELDELRLLRDGARDFIAQLQARERERTGIGSLKVGFNRVFGYYLEVTRANLSRVPEDFIRKQTLANAERYFTLELKEWEEKVFDAEDRIARLEQTLFLRVRAELALRRAAHPGGQPEDRSAGCAGHAWPRWPKSARLCSPRSYYRVRPAHRGGPAPGGRDDDAPRGLHSQRPRARRGRSAS